MNKKLVAIFVATLMIVGLFPATMIPVANAQVPIPCTTANLLALPDTPPFCVFLHPGVNDTYRPAFSHTLGTLWGTQYAWSTPAGQNPFDAGAVALFASAFPGTPENNPQTRQVFDRYLDYAILASSSDSIGDLQFDLSIPITPVPAPAGWPHTGNVSRIDIFVPPEFEWLAPTMEEAVWTDITNDHRFLSVGRMSEFDPIAPNWVRIRIGQDGTTGGRMNITQGETWHVRLFDLKAPSIAGLYHFKIYAATNEGLPWGGLLYESIGEDNYPIIVVKDELNPAWIEVVVRTHNIANAPPYSSGQVLAEGTTPEGRAVTAWSFFSRWDFIGNSLVPGQTGARYRSYIFGVAEGTYTLTAQASGWNPTTTDRITVLAGQSYHIDIIIYDSPDVHITMWSKHGTGAIPWHNLWQMPHGTNNPALMPNDAQLNAAGNPAVRDVLLKLYDANGEMIGWWASDTIHGATAAAPWTAGYPELYGGVQKELAPPNMLLGLHDDANPAFGPPGTVGGTVPTRTNYQAWLVDNVDMTWAWATGAGGTARRFPSTHWDGHVPWTWADYIAGMPNAEYTVEAYVTGYIMDEADAYQRTFSLVGISMELQFDLRRSNWIETTIHNPTWALSPANQLSGPTTVTLTAEDAGAHERAAVAFQAVAADSADGVINGADVSLGAPAYGGGIVIEGWNAVYPNFGWFFTLANARDPNLADYGLNPSASSHTMGTVPLAGNPYTIKLYMADMGEPSRRINGTGWYNIVGGDPQVSVYLCNSPTPLSFIVVNASAWISLRSTDFEIPAHSRPWTFPGSEIWVEFINEAGEQTAILDPTLYGLIQDPGTTNATLGWPIPGVSYSVPQLWQGWVNHGYGVSPYDVDAALNATGQYTNPAGLHEHVGVWFTGSDWASAPTWFWGLPLEYTLMAPFFRSTRLPPGTYTYNAYTHGYIQRRSYPVSMPLAGAADIEADLIQGGQIRVWFEFLHEGVRTPFNGFVNVEVFNANNELVGASIYGQAQPNYFTLLNAVYRPGGYLNYSRFADHMQVVGPAQGADLGLWRTAALHLDGNEAVWTLPSSNGQWSAVGANTAGATTNLFMTGQRAFTSSIFYSSNLAFSNVPPVTGRPIPIKNPRLPVVALGPGQVHSGRWNTWANYPGWNATAHFRADGSLGAWHRSNVQYSDANRLQMAAADVSAFDVYGFYWYFGDAVRTWAGGWPTVNGWQMSQGFNGGNWWLGTGQWDYGLKGSVDIPGWAGSGGGLYSVKVTAFDGRGPNNAYEFGGSTFLGPYSFSDDWRMYEMGWELTSVQVPWGGAVELWMSMNAMATLRGAVRWFDMFGNLRALPWAQVTASPGPATDSYPAYASGLAGFDSSGTYIMWLPSGTHDVSVSTSEAPGAWSSSAPTNNAQYTVVVSPGWVGGGDSQLAGSGLPVPELPAFVVPLGLFAALAASAWLLRKRNLNAPLPVILK